MVARALRRQEFESIDGPRNRHAIKQEGDVKKERSFFRYCFILLKDQVRATKIVLGDVKHLRLAS